MHYAIRPRSRLAETDVAHILSGFADDRTASEVSAAGGVSVRTVNDYFQQIRRYLAVEQRLALAALRERALLPMPVHSPASADAFGLVMHAGELFVEALPQRVARVLRAGRKERPEDGSAEPAKGEREQEAFAGMWNTYLGLLDARCCHVVQGPWLRAHRLDDPEARRISGELDVFQQMAAARFRRFYGIHHHTLALHVYESAFRFSQRQRQLMPALLERFSERPLWE